MSQGVQLVTKLLANKYRDERFFDGEHIGYVYAFTEKVLLTNQ
jgi:hypothetical protein